ncbi:MAG: FHA domain-containing protein, partial [Planctomycetaceae bacterium]|nr:FHA domain-containing protein [Planctomycetaceae bacterium]
MPTATNKTLELRVTRAAGETPAEPMAATFGPEGGSLGRRQENDWVLPDPERFISGQHALISFSDGQFYITDTSVNGVFLNQSAVPLGKGDLTPLHEGDSLLIGDYEITAFTQQSQTDALVRTDEFDDPFAGI